MLRQSSTIAAPPRARHDAPPPPAADPAGGQPRKPRHALARLAPLASAAVMAAVWLAIKPHTVDMAAHVFRAKLFGEQGFTIWNGLWYGGHHTPAYSVLFPPLGWLLTPWVAGALSAVACAALFEPLAHRQWGRRGDWAALWFGIATGSLLFTGRLPFALGVAFALAALLARQRERTWLAVAMAIASGLASPVAALFLALVAISFFDWGLAAAAFIPPALLAAAFPEGGYMPFDFSTYLPVPLLALVVAVFVPRSQRALRIGAVLYALATTAAFFIHTPMGSNAVRLGTLFAGPVVLATAAIPKRYAPRALLAALLALMLAWQWSSAWRDFAASQNEPSAKVSYYKPLQEFLATQHPELGRVEIPFTRSHWEAAEIAPQFPLARGWERQLDAGRNALFYSGPLSDFTYANWLAEHAVQFVALPDVKPDESSFGERGLIEADPPYLHLIRRLPHWRVYAFTLPHPMVIPEEGVDIRLTKLGSDHVALDAKTAGSALVRVQWSPYWRLRGGCVERAGDWTEIVAKRPGRLELTMSFALSRVLDRGHRCG